MRTLHLALSVTLLSLLGCHRSDSAASEAAPSSAASTTSAAVPSASAGAPSDPTTDPSCALVTKAEAEAIVGEKLQDLRVTYNGMCEYLREADRGK
jgi:hypothetical protein